MRMGFVHVPKCAGTSLSNALYDAFGTRRVHISSMVPKGAVPRPSGIARKSMAFRLAQCAPFLSGHISYTDMRAMDRDRVITAFREPASRFFSLFTYRVGRAARPEMRDRKPKLAESQGLSFVAFCGQVKANGIARRVLGDIPAVRELIQLPPEAEADLRQTPEALARLDAGLGRYDMILCGKLDHIVSHLAPLTPAGAIHVEQLNESPNEQVFEIGCDEAELAARLDAWCWLDRIVLERAAALFPETCLPPAANSAETVAGLKRRYNLDFAA